MSPLQAEPCRSLPWIVSFAVNLLLASLTLFVIIEVGYFGMGYGNSWTIFLSLLVAGLYYLVPHSLSNGSNVARYFHAGVSAAFLLLQVLDIDYLEPYFGSSNQVISWFFCASSLSITGLLISKQAAPWFSQGDPKG